MFSSHFHFVYLCFASEEIVEQLVEVTTLVPSCLWSSSSSKYCNYLQSVTLPTLCQLDDVNVRVTQKTSALYDVSYMSFISHTQPVIEENWLTEFDKVCVCRF